MIILFGGGGGVQRPIFLVILLCNLITLNFPEEGGGACPDPPQDPRMLKDPEGRYMGLLNFGIRATSDLEFDKPLHKT